MASQQPDRARPNCRSRTSCQSPVQVSRRGRYLVHPANPTSHHSTDKRSASRYILDPTWRWRLWTLRAEHTRATSSTILSACTFDTLAQLQSFSRSLAEERKGGSQCPCQAEARCGASPVDRKTAQPVGRNDTAGGPNRHVRQAAANLQFQRAPGGLQRALAGSRSETHAETIAYHNAYLT